MVPLFYMVLFPQIEVWRQICSHSSSLYILTLSFFHIIYNFLRFICLYFKSFRCIDRGPFHFYIGQYDSPVLAVAQKCIETDIHALHTIHCLFKIQLYHIYLIGRSLNCFQQKAFFAAKYTHFMDHAFIYLENILQTN